VDSAEAGARGGEKAEFYDRDGKLSVLLMIYEEAVVKWKL
jgi:hypothetical protein